MSEADGWKPIADRLDRPIYIPCECWTAEHFLRIEPDEDLDGALNVAFLSTRSASFFHRVKWALKHVFGRDDLVFADIIIKRDWFADVVKPAPLPTPPKEGE